MPLTTHGRKSQREIESADDKYIAAGPPSHDELMAIIDKVPPAPSVDEPVIDEPGEPGWPAAPVEETK